MRQSRVLQSRRRREWEVLLERLCPARAPFTRKTSFKVRSDGLIYYERGWRTLGGILRKLEREDYRRRREAGRSDRATDFAAPGSRGRIRRSEPRLFTEEQKQRRRDQKRVYQKLNAAKISE